MKPLYVLTILMICSVTAYSQDISTSTIEWNSVSTFDAHEGMNIDEQTKVVTSQTQIKWYDSNGVIKRTYDITGTEGSWTNIANTGFILFHITSGDTPGIVRVMRANGRLTILVQLVFENTVDIHELIIATTNSL